MKKILFAGCALVALGAVSAQAADPISLSITGFTKEFVGVASNKDSAVYVSGTASGNPANKRATFDQQMDSNINFVGKTKLDNGLTVLVEVDTLIGTPRLDGKANPVGNPAARRSYVTVSGGFGSLTAGSRENLSYIIHNSAPDVGIGIEDNTTDGKNWISNPSGHAFFDGTQTSRFDGRADKIIYLTPNFYGLTAGFSYTPEISRSGQGNTSMASSNDSLVSSPVGAVTGLGNNSVGGRDFGSGDLFVEGVTFNNTFSGISTKADFSAGQLNFASERLYSTGAQIGYAGVTIGGGYLKRDVPNNAVIVNPLTGAAITQSASVTNTHSAAQAAGYAGQTWDVGVSYAISDYAASLSYFHDATHNSANSGTDTTKSVMLSGKYTMGPGISLVGSVFRMEYDSSAHTATAKTANENSGWAGVTGIVVNF